MNPIHDAIRLCLGGVLVCGAAVAQSPPADERPATERQQASSELPAGNAQVAEIMKTFAPRGVQSDGSQPTPPQEALKSFRLHDGLEIDLVASEPEISQPLFLSWDSRGRMWVVQYRQYQYPAGLKVVRYDHHLRAVFDKVPAAPPNHTPGQDRITVFEDTTGDGKYDSHRDVITGLNIASSVAIGSGGIWVLNPPYLLRYADEDQDAVPDNETPEVHLSGFGIQDTHSVANSMLWGPDGWLYGANGSTTTGNVASQATPNVAFQGQCIWRYHPKTHIFEIYAEGGGNTFSLDIDSKGHVFSGTNGGNTRGWFYPQGSYSRKNWGKHGPLTNPYAFGFFEAMKFQGDGRRFPQAFIIYEGGLLPETQYAGTIIAPNAMQNLTWHSQRLADGSSFQTVDNPNLLESSDRWFRPVYCGVGPDGAIYIADWYDTRLSHVSPTDDWHKTSGRVYRIRPEDTQPKYALGDLSTKSDSQLMGLFTHENKWVRRRAALELGWRPALQTASPRQLLELVQQQACLEALWSLNLQDLLDSDLAGSLLQHSDPDIRRWTVRLLGDRRESHSGLSRLAAHEENIHVRSQLAATARRVDATTGLAILRQLLTYDQDAGDPQLPLMLWWALESHATQWPAVEQFLSDKDLWHLPLFRNIIAERITRRYAAAGTAEGLEHCAEIVELVADASLTPKLIAGLNQAYQGRVLPPLPDSLQAALEAYRADLGAEGLVLRVLQGDELALPIALKELRDSSQDIGSRIELAKALGEVAYAPAADVLLQLATASANPPALQRVAIQSLVRYDAPQIPDRLTRAMDSQISAEHGIRDACCRTLASRRPWALALLKEVNQWRLHADQVPPDVVQRLRTYPDAEVRSEVERAFGKPADIASADKVQQIRQLTESLSQDQGNSSAGKAIFDKNCGNCHQLFGRGATIGPALDNYDRGNLQFWLPAIIAPSIEIREGFQSYAALTQDGRVITGTLAAQDLQTLTLRDVENRSTVLRRDDLEEFRAIETSLMPEKLLDPLSEQEIFDLFAYLRSNLPRRETAP